MSSVTEYRAKLQAFLYLVRAIFAVLLTKGIVRPFLRQTA